MKKEEGIVWTGSYVLDAKQDLLHENISIRAIFKVYKYKYLENKTKNKYNFILDIKKVYLYNKEE